jgi:pimeloyl-ACP methyl ester carboxylesterase
MLRRVGPIAAAPLALCVVAIAAFATGCGGWRSGVIRKLAQDSMIAETARGPIEYAEVGQGRPVLFLHGTPGGYDGPFSLLTITQQENSGLRFVIPSRPGYLRTPLSVGSTPADQADAFVALLDELGVGRAVVIGFSGGGPSALQVALRHPDRCSSLVLESALVRSSKPGSEGLPGNAFETWLRDAQDYILRIDAEHARIPSDPGDAEIHRIVRAGRKTGGVYSLRKAGAENDARQETHLDGWPLDQITCPTLILHGADDGTVPPSDAEYAHAQIPGAELELFPGQDHGLTVMKHKEVAERIRSFLAEHP